MKRGLLLPKRRACAAGLFLLGAMTGVRLTANEVQVWPAPEGIPAAEAFDVKVRAPDGDWKAVFCYRAQVDMHRPRTASVAAFDFSGRVEVSVKCRAGAVSSVRIRPLAAGVTPKIEGDIVTFDLTEPRNLSIEVNGDRFENLHLFAGPVEAPPDPKTPGLRYFGPGVHEPGKLLEVKSGEIVYLAGGAVVKTTIVCKGVENVRIFGRGVLYQGERGIEIAHSKNVIVDGITVIDPRYYTVLGGESRDVTIHNFKSFSYQGWSDGIDLMSCSDVLIEGVFLRNSDDCIAIYGHRWEYYGDARNINVRNSVLWADVAHPIFIGTHGNPAKPETLENLAFENIDILDQDEPHLNYQGCLAINVSDENLVRDVRFENIRIEEIERGQFFNFRVAFNRKYATAPGRGIENVALKNIICEGDAISILAGYNEHRMVKKLVFENLRINGQLIRNADEGRIFVGEHVEGLEFKVSKPER